MGDMESKSVISYNYARPQVEGLEDQLIFPQFKYTYPSFIHKQQRWNY